MSLRRRLLLAALLAGALTLIPAVGSPGITPTVKTVETGLYTYGWSPTEVGVSSNSQVTFANSTAGVPHGIVWTSASKPVCEASVPDGQEGKATSSSSSWTGACTFSTAGTYTYRCYVHPYMTGTVTVTNPGEPVAISEAATGVAETGAQLNGTVNPEGHETTYMFEWGRTASYEEGHTAVQTLSAGSTNEKASAALSGLAPATTYHFRLVAKNEKGTVQGSDETFTTLGPPMATTEAATAVTESGATLRGAVNPDGHPTTYVFEYGTTTSYGTETSAQPAVEGTTSASVSVPVTGLAAGTTYHYRLVAKNEKGTVEGADRTFTTLSPLPPKEPPANEPSPTPSPTPSPSPTPTPTPAPGPIAPQPELAPLVPPLVDGTLKLATPRHSTAVRGSLEVSRSGAGGRLEVELIANSASLAKRGHQPKQVTVGRLVRNSLPAGKVSFSVGVNARGKSALRHRHKLVLTVKVTLTPPSGKAVRIVRSVLLRA